MEVALVVASQTVVMFLYMLVGAVAFKAKKITVEGSRDLTTLLVTFIMPSVVIRSFCVERTAERTQDLLLSFALGAAALAVSMAIARLFFRKSAIDQFAAAFSNTGFIGIPLVEATLGSEAVFYFAGFNAMLGVLQWTYGTALLTDGKQGADLHGILLNPSTVAVVAGMLIYASGLGGMVPAVAATALKGLAAANAPLAMVILGVYLAQADLADMALNPRLYALAAVRLVVIPLATWALFAVVPGDATTKLAILIGASAPAGCNVAMFAQLYDLDYPYACQGVVLSTLFSIATMPLLMLLA